ncbi:metal-dependent hydrolase family protein [Marinicella litoralis]|uniref:Imidazolonepropionase-like amidohydrolase n=1 Tax=Marinicella litoralis TaxID=644220 RepID=A0A4V3DHA5_9GAMM|nr:amidohydrolase family protein [Marinicella litoralis]TDR17471.1 imidazolonepropionase-like amidohydrolase [Marinicella litoralis]
MKKQFLIVSLICSQVASATTIKCGGLFDAASGKMLTDQVVTIEGNQFTSIDDYAAQNIDLDYSGQFCLPGLMDMHTHITHENGPNRYIEKFQHNEADVAFNAVVFAERTLVAGFTTIRDLGDAFNVSVALKNAINQGKIVGPRIFTAAKSLATTGGHADPSNGYRDDLFPHTTPDHGVVNGPSDAMRAVRQRYQDGADLIKITATGGVLSQASSGDNAQFNKDELNALIATANDYGFKVAAHAHGKGGMLRAIEAGVSSIEHGTYLDEEVIKAMKKHGTYLVPTLIAGDWVTEKSKIDGFFPAVVAKKAATIGPLLAGSFNRAYKAGVNIAFGTDSGVSEHGRNGEEFGLMVKNGMTQAEALQAATIHAASLLGQENNLGQIKLGYLADMVVVADNPIEEIKTMENIHVVIKDGKIVKQ